MTITTFQMQSQISYALQSRCHSSMLEQVDFINSRITHAQNRLNTLANKSSVASLHSTLGHDTSTTNRSHASKIHSRRESGSRGDLTVNTKIVFEAEETTNKDFCEVEEPNRKERKRFVDEVSLLQRKHDDAQGQLRLNKNALRSREAEIDSKDKAVLSQQLKELRSLITLEMGKSVHLDKANHQLKDKVHSLEHKNQRLETQMRELRNTINGSSRSQRERQLEEQLLHSLEQFQLYRENLYQHHRDCLILCELMSYTSDIFNRLKNTEIPATAVMIKEQINAHLPLAGVIKSKILQIHPQMEKVELKSRRDPFRSFIGDKENISPNSQESLFHKVSLSAKNTGKGIHDEQMMRLLLTQAQIIEKCLC